MKLLSLILIMIFTLFTKDIEAAEMVEQTFKKLTNHIIPFQDYTTVASGIRSPLQCMSLCAEETNCKTVAYFPEDAYCMHSVLLPVAVDNVEDGSIIYARHLESCPKGYFYNLESQTCFRFISSPVYWQQAHDNCTAAGEYLLTFGDGNEASEWLREFMQHQYDKGVGYEEWNKPVWIGGQRKVSGGNFTWDGIADGEVSLTDGISDWSTGEPSSLENSMALRADGWFDTSGSNLTNYMCEMKLMV